MSLTYAPGECYVLAVDASPSRRIEFARAFEPLFTIKTTDTPATARELLTRGFEFGALVLDMDTPGALQLWTWLCQYRPELAQATVVLAADVCGDTLNALMAHRTGWVVQKPLLPIEICDKLWERIGDKKTWTPKWATAPTMAGSRYKV